MLSTAIIFNLHKNLFNKKNVQRVFQFVRVIHSTFTRRFDFYDCLVQNGGVLTGQEFEK